MTHLTGLRVAAVLFTVFYLGASFLPTLPEGGYSDTKVLGLLEDGGSRTVIVVGAYLLAAAGVTFLCFVSLLTSRLAADARTPLVNVAANAGTAYGVMLLVASSLFGSLPMGRALGELPESRDAMLFRTLSNAGFHALLVGGLVAAAVTIVAISLALRRTGGAPAWCVLAGIVIAPLLLLGLMWVPQFLVALWTLVVAFGLRPRSRAEGPRAQPARSPVESRHFGGA